MVVIERCAPQAIIYCFVDDFERLCGLDKLVGITILFW